MYNNLRNTRNSAQRKFFQEIACANSWNRYYSKPEANVLELDDRFLVEVALPGVVLDDVEIKAEEHFLTIQAKRLPVAFEEDALIHIQEMPFSYLLREFEFFAPIVTEQIEARMDRGILYISVPKLEVTHRIPVSAGMIESRLPGLKTQIISKTDSSRHNKEVVSK